MPHPTLRRPPAPRRRVGILRCRRKTKRRRSLLSPGGPRPPAVDGARLRCGQIFPVPAPAVTMDLTLELASTVYGYGIAATLPELRAAGAPELTRKLLRIFRLPAGPLPMTVRALVGVFSK